MLLSEITDDDEPVYELNSIVSTFPKTYTKIIDKLKGSDKLLFHGQPVYGADGDHGPAVKDTASDVNTEIKNGNTEIEENIVVPAFSIDGEHYDSTHWDFELPIKEGQHVWTGYDPKSGEMLIGFDGWAHEDDFNVAWDKFFEETTGKEFDYDDHEHRHIYDKVHKIFRTFGFYGLLYGYNPLDGIWLKHYHTQGFHKGLASIYINGRGFIPL